MNEIDLLCYYMEKDLNLHPFGGEDKRDFHFRLIYSGLSNWILRATKDRDFEDGKYQQVSKSHVTNLAMDLLNSYVSLDSVLSVYFKPELENGLISRIEHNYLNLGYFNSGNYSFYPQRDSIHIKIDDSLSLCIDDSSDSDLMVGIGIYDHSAKDDINLEDFILAKTDAENTFEKMDRMLKYEPFDYTGQGFVETYQVDRKRWLPFYPKYFERFPYSVVRFDKLTYSIVKKNDGKLMKGNLPLIYNKAQRSAPDKYYQREIWRIIAGVCKKLGYPFKVAFKKYCSDGLLINFYDYNYFIFPQLESCLISAMSWPERDCLDNMGLITNPGFENAFRRLFGYFNIEIVEER